MPHLPDLSAYTLHPVPGRTMLAVGWLARGRPFPTGPTPVKFQQRLLELAKRPVHLGQTHHHCAWCATRQRRHALADGRVIATDQIIVKHDGADVFLGNGEIHVQSQTGTWFVAPTLIYHYVTEHGYQPPQEFIDAVLDPANDNLATALHAYRVSKAAMAPAEEVALGYPTGATSTLDRPVNYSFIARLRRIGRIMRIAYILIAVLILTPLVIIAVMWYVGWMQDLAP